MKLFLLFLFALLSSAISADHVVPKWNIVKELDTIAIASTRTIIKPTTTSTTLKPRVTHRQHIIETTLARQTHSVISTSVEKRTETVTVTPTINTDYPVVTVTRTQLRTYGKMRYSYATETRTDASETYLRAVVTQSVTRTHLRYQDHTSTLRPIFTTTSLSPITPIIQTATTTTSTLYTTSSRSTNYPTTATTTITDTSFNGIATDYLVVPTLTRTFVSPSTTSQEVRHTVTSSEEVVNTVSTTLVVPIRYTKLVLTDTNAIVTTVHVDKSVWTTSTKWVVQTVTHRLAITSTVTKIDIGRSSKIVFYTSTSTILMPYTSSTNAAIRYTLLVTK